VSRYDLAEPGRVMAEVAYEIFERDVERHARRVEAMAALTGEVPV
jgi:hypothetical protein